MSPLLRLKTFGGLAIHRPGAPAEGAGAQRRRLALLALLAAAGDRGMSREKLHGFLWPESDLERARKNLAQAVYALRRDLNAEDLILGTTDLRLNPDLITSDLADVRRALAEQRLEDAVALYEGPFLDGIYLDEAPEFERWAESERANLAHEYAQALETVAGQAAERGEPRLATGYWRRLANADPLNSRVALGLMKALAAAGDRGAALQHYRVYEMLLRQELDIAPDPAVSRLAEDLRQQGEWAAGAAPQDRTPVTPPATGPGPGTPRPLSEPPVSTLPGTPAITRPAPTNPLPIRAVTSGLTDEYARPRPLPERPAQPAPLPMTWAPGPRPPVLKRRSTRHGMAIGFALGLVVVAGAVLFRRELMKGNAPATPVVAVGRIQDYTRARENLTRPLADMLATDLARARDLHVISTARTYELLAQGGQISDSAAALVRAARAAGATELLDGALYELPGGKYRLDLRRTSLASGSMLDSYSAVGDDLFALVGEAREVMARGVEDGPPGSWRACPLPALRGLSAAHRQLHDDGFLVRRGTHRPRVGPDPADQRRGLGSGELGPRSPGALSGGPGRRPDRDRPGSPVLARCLSGARGLPVR
jgi:DNA-binding SARP family transcriptional activator/TolB-like protein